MEGHRKLSWYLEIYICAQNWGSNPKTFKINMGHVVYHFKGLCKPYTLQLKFFCYPYPFQNVYTFTFECYVSFLADNGSKLFCKKWWFRHNFLSNSTPQEIRLSSLGRIPPPSPDIFWTFKTCKFLKKLNKDTLRCT